MTSSRLLVIGSEELADTVGQQCEKMGADVVRLREPSDVEIRLALTEGIDAVAVISQDDILALRYALVAEHISPGVTLLVTIFDRTVANQVVKAVPNCTVIAMADAMVPALAGPCVAEKFAALYRDGRTYGAVTGGRETLGVEAFHPPSVMARRAVLGKVLGQLRPPDRSSRAMLSGLIGLALVLVIDVVLSVYVLHEKFADAVLDAARTLATVAGSPAVAHAPTWYKLYSAASMLATLALAAVFTAGLVNRIMSRRLTGIVGSRAVPRRGHVVVVGLGQVGLRLCIELAELGIGVVAVERDGQARNIPLARALGIPVVVGQGGDRFLLQRLSLKRARALAAVSADGLENIAVAVAALAVAPDLRIVLRAGDDDAAAESRSLFKIGFVCDVNRLAGPYLAAAALGLRPIATFPVDSKVYALLGDGTILDVEQLGRTPDPIPQAATMVKEP